MIQQIKNAIIGLCGISLVILVHEAGHFLACKLCGVRTLVFSIGFDPAIFSFRFLKTTFQIGLFPIGGYVSIDPYALALAPFAQKMFIMFAGIAANIIFALFIFNYLRSKGFQPESVEQENNQVEQKKQSQFIGPIGIIAMIAKSSAQGFDAFVYLLGVVSINVAMLNLLPFPPFDGGQAVSFTLEAVTGRSFSSGIFDLIQNIIILLLIMGTIFIAFRDIKHLFKR